MSDVHENINTLIAAYALGAIPENEIRAIRAHIMSCEECFSEAESYATSLAMLAELVEPVAPPKGFEDRVLAAVGDGSPAPETARRPSPRPRRWAMALGVAGLAAVLLVAVVAIVQVITLRQQYRDVVAALVHDPNALTLQGPGGAEGTIASTPNGSVLVALDLGEAPEGSDYQLWLMDEGEPVPADTFDVDGSIAIVESDRDLEGFDGAAVTVEPEGGSEQPTTDPVLSSS